MGKILSLDDMRINNTLQFCVCYPLLQVELNSNAVEDEGRNYLSEQLPTVGPHGESGE